MGVEVPDSVARIVWEALRDRLATAAATNGGAQLHPDARGLLNRLRAAAYRHLTTSASGSPDLVGDHAGRGDASRAATEVPTAVAAHRLGVTPRRIRQLAADGRIPARKHGRDWVIQLDQEDMHDGADQQPRSGRRR